MVRLKIENIGEAPAKIKLSWTAAKEITLDLTPGAPQEIETE